MKAIKGPQSLSCVPLKMHREDLEELISLFKQNSEEVHLYDDLQPVD